MTNKINSAFFTTSINLSSSKKTIGNDFMITSIYAMVGYLMSWMTSFIPNQFLKRFRWCPTSFEELDEAEKNILSYVKKPFVAEYVNIGTEWGYDDGDVKIWTLKMNTTSRQTPLVMIHGFASGVGLWIMNLDALSSNCPVYAFDLLGFGKSSRPRFGKDAIEAENQFVCSIEAWRKKLGLQRFFLLGHSLGGFIAAAYALKHPDRVAHLILCDPWGFPERPISTSHRYNLPTWVKVVVNFLRPFNPLASLRAAGPAGPILLKRVRTDLRRKFSSVINDEEAIHNYLYHCNAQTPSGEVAFKAMTGEFGWAKQPMISRIDSLRPNVPITFIYGSKSWIDKQTGILIKNSRLDSYVNVQVIQRSGHHVYADQPDYFNRLVRKICNTDWQTTTGRVDSETEPSSADENAPERESSE
ncbi:(Lyso)-N-acylphosphatidylethanolamine lipase-like isoform X1 [Centruroides vittatus]|uniref:(Lyso)-N-acylphosphatidylethanolamine lipase-like isoform X1 n=2 Tax=Centruroides vittatus TaxID=120091 RepID=UPI003510629C